MVRFVVSLISRIMEKIRVKVIPGELENFVFNEDFKNIEAGFGW